ncbi:MAG: TonB-dependent receptor plug domain-containing protein [Chitinophagaceae bacterium]
MLLCIFTELPAQSILPATDSVSKTFLEFSKSSKDESIVLSTDRDLYIAGERIWFCAWALNSGKIDVTTKNLFADIVNESDSVIEQLVLDNRNFHTQGAFKLPETIPSGFYWIRCYTASQISSINPDILLKPVFVINQRLHDSGVYNYNSEKKIVGKKNDLSIHFYPERLTRLPNIISTGVLEIKDDYNNPALVNGELVDNKDSVLMNFKTNSLGFARLTFLNRESQTYSAVFHWGNKTVRYNLPDRIKSQVQLSVMRQDAGSVKAFVTLEDDAPSNLQTTILAVQNDSLYYAAVGSGSYGTSIPVSGFPTGVVRLLLFDNNKNLVDERKIFIPGESSVVTINPDKKKYAVREKVDLHVKVTNDKGKPLVSILNVAIQNEWIDKFSDSISLSAMPPSDNLLIEKWLNDNNGKYSDDDLDILMITRKPDVNNKTDEYTEKENYDYDDNTKLANLVGKIVTQKGRAINGDIVTAIARNTNEFFMDADTTIADGSWKIALPQGFDSLKLSLQTSNKKGVITTDSIVTDQFRFPAFATPASLKKLLYVNSLNKLSILKKINSTTDISFLGKGWITLAPVTVKAFKQKELNYDASKRINQISQILTSDKFRYGGFNAIGNAVLTVPGINYLNGDIFVFGHGIKSLPPLIIMDGTPVNLTTDGKPGGGTLDFLNTLNPADIDFIEILRGGEAGIFGVNAGGGVISINTKHGPDRTDFSKSKLHLITPLTYHVSPKFEMPDYSNAAIKNNSNPDLRTTIYWNANIKTDANGEADISFYTGDNSGKYIVTITGLTVNGKIIHKKTTIDVTGKSR